MARAGYDEQTLVHIPTLAEVYGADGYGWYCDRDTASELFQDVRKREGANPLFRHLEGMTRRKLVSRGFVGASK